MLTSKPAREVGVVDVPTTADCATGSQPRTVTLVSPSPTCRAENAMTSWPTVIETGWAPGALPVTADHIENVCPEMHQSRPVRCAISSIRPRAVSLRSAYFTGAVGRSIVPSESPASWTRRDTMSL